MALLSRFRVLRRRGPSAAGEHPSPQPLQLSHLEVGSPPTTDLNGVSLPPSRRYMQLVRDLRPSLPSACRWLGPEDVDLVGEHPMAAGGSANIWEGTCDGRGVVLKTYRCCASSDATQVVERFCNEVRIASLLHHGGAGVLPLVGVYSTDAHPFGLVYEYLDGLDLKQYLRNEPNTDSLKLLTGVARGLNRIHDLGIVHGNLGMTNILIDNGGTPRIAGLGNATALPNSTTWTAEGTACTDRLSRTCAPELTWPGASSSPTDPTKASDMYAFGVIAWEVLTGQPPFYGMTEMAATYSMLTGARPPRPDNNDISDRVWDMIKRCWDGVPSRRLSVAEAVNILEIELGCAPGSCSSAST